MDLQQIENEEKKGYSSPLIDRYIQLLKAYNEHTNVYSKHAYEHLEFHIKDCITMANMISNDEVTVMDIGSGSGLPSVILAIQNPKNTVYAVESKVKKVRFLEHIKDSLKLTNFKVIHMNVTEYIHLKVLQPDFVTAKAFGSYDKVKRIVQGLKKSPKATIIPISEAQEKELLESGENKKIFRRKNGYLYIYF